MRPIAALVALVAFTFAVVGATPAFADERSATTATSAPGTTPTGELAPVVELVPSVHRGHSVQWKTGAIITASSFGVGALGAALLVLGMMSSLNHPAEVNNELIVPGSIFLAIGGAGIGIAGPLVWVTGIGGPPDPN